MGSTVITDIRISHVKVEGADIYGFYTSSYDKNVYPHRAYLNCEGFGTREQILAYIFEFASQFVGGMLQGPSGPILPETVISRCFKAIRNPYIDHTHGPYSALTEVLGLPLGRMVREFTYPTFRRDYEFYLNPLQDIEVPLPMVTRLDADNYQVEGCKHPKWAYEIMQEFIAKMPPCKNYRAHIKALRNRLQTAAVKR